MNVPAIYFSFAVCQFKKFGGVENNWKYDDYKNIVDKILFGDPSPKPELANESKSYITLKSHYSGTE